MIKVNTSMYYKQVITAFVVSLFLGFAFFMIFRNIENIGPDAAWVSFVVVPIFMAFYAKDINRSFYLLGDKRKNRFHKGTFVFAGDIDQIKRAAERAKNIKEGRLGAARMSLVEYAFKEYNKENAEVIKMYLYIPDSVNYRYILSRILSNKDHRFKITYAEKSRVITEFQS